MRAGLSRSWSEQLSAERPVGTADQRAISLLCDEIVGACSGRQWFELVVAGEGIGILMTEPAVQESRSDRED